MTSFSTEDDVLTLLIHLGYLSYNAYDHTVRIPNFEIMNEFVTAVAASDWGEVSTALRQSYDTLEAIWQERELQVAQNIESAHFETSYLQYNDENALSYTLSLALYAARNFYHIFRELPSGKGFADMVFLPLSKYAEKPAMIVELKWQKSAKGAIAQIKEKHYADGLRGYHGELLLVGINYNKKTKVHECKIEKMLYPIS